VQDLVVGEPLVAAHDEAGSLGLVLNRPTALVIPEVAPRLAVLPTDGLIHEGGPVEPDGLVVLADFLPTVGDHLEIDGTLGLVRGSGEDPDEIATTIDRCRIFAGHASWGPGQLDEEIERDAWLVTDRRAGDAFSEHPEDLWLGVLERLGGSYAVLARIPDDPRAN